MNEKANDHQVGGEHYMMGGDVQHWDFVTQNNLNYLEGCATKYVSRWKKKHGRQDLEKARHYVQKLIECHNRALVIAPRWRRAKKPLVISVFAFAQANGLDGDEAIICEMLATWRGPADLERALAMIDQLIEGPAA